jgi:glycosyltransferase involved in cell wall biosynthesis
MHDTDVGDRLTEARAAKFTNIVVLTEWHKKHMLEVYPFLVPSQLVVVPNGINLEFFNGEDPVRNTKRVVYSSSPDRGLDTILEHIWPRVVEQVPDAELHIYYGWNNFDAYIPMFPHLGEFKNKVMNLLGRSKNVVQHGRVSPQKLIDEMRSGGVWLYPTYFSETYCITAVEAQLSGLWPITNDLAGLSETVRSGSLMSTELNEEVITEYVQATVEAMNGAVTEETRAAVIRSAPAVSWDSVAKMWSERWLE